MENRATFRILRPSRRPRHSRAGEARCQTRKSRSSCRVIPSDAELHAWTRARRHGQLDEVREHGVLPWRLSLLPFQIHIVGLHESRPTAVLHTHPVCISRHDFHIRTILQLATPHLQLVAIEELRAVPAIILFDFPLGGLRDLRCGPAHCERRRAASATRVDRFGCDLVTRHATCWATGLCGGRLQRAASEEGQHNGHTVP
mmetsp:Transcript_61793/g.177222  ORF Transcript_61793/g.177222 Transcript_61793/m.177222 type:complete len:201 (-) Transcript_61793:971-1573(-)